MHPEEMLYRMKEARAKYLSRDKIPQIFKDNLERLIFSEMSGTEEVNACNTDKKNKVFYRLEEE